MYISIGLSKKELLPLLASNKMYIPQSITQLIDIVSPISNYIFLFGQVILVNGQFPGPTVNVVTNDNVIVQVENKLDEPILLTWYVS